MASAALLRACLEVIHFSGASQILRATLRGKGSIFCLHHVCPGGGLQTGFAPNSKLEVTPKFLEQIILLSRKHGLETVSIAEAARRITTPKPNDKPFVVFTLDDGYKDNQIYAQPIFDRLNCPYTVFVAPNIANGTCELWWRALEHIIAQNEHLKLTTPQFVCDIKTKTEAQKSAAWNKLSVVIAALPELAQRTAIRALAKAYDFNLEKLCLSVAMTWDEIRAINKDPLCTIGAHTMNHYSVKKLTSEQCTYELTQSKLEIERELGEPVQFFAYPYGDEPAAGPRDFAIAHKAGYLASVTTRKGVVFEDHKNHMQALPRIMVSGRYQKLRYIDALISGAPTALLNRMSKVNVS
ncbi:MAG: polysaccharide deacetylase family protein [Alphaproteobacteria bacterium]|nr:polysaccharide deacetylase family protein [Alphaproteobacteria bacterium]